MSKTLLPITHHLTELRIRVLYCIFSIFLTFISCYYYSEQIFYLLAKPLMDEVQNTGELSDLGKRYFIYTDVTEAFITYIKVSLFTSVYICFPVIMYQMWIFLVPGLYKYERKKLGIFCLLSFLLFSLGGLIAYFLIFPVAWKFFLSFELANHSHALAIQLQPKINEYIILVIKILFLFGLCFQFPIYLILLTHMNLITPTWFIKKRNISCVISFIVAAMLSPPDIISQIILVIPLLLFYELAIFTMKLLEQYRKL